MNCMRIVRGFQENYVEYLQNVSVNFISYYIFWKNFEESSCKFWRHYKGGEKFSQNCKEIPVRF